MRNLKPRIIIYTIFWTVSPVEVFVAILGCSQLTYVEATESQRKEDFIGSCENALHFFGGVPQALVTDNLKSAVTKASRYEAVLNEDFAALMDEKDSSVFLLLAGQVRQNVGFAFLSSFLGIVSKLPCPMRRAGAFRHTEFFAFALTKNLPATRFRPSPAADCISGRPKGAACGLRSNPEKVTVANIFLTRP